MARESFGALLKRYRLTAGISQGVLAERASLSAPAIAALENGRRQSPYRETVRALATALELTKEEAAQLEAAVRRRRSPAAPAQLASAPVLPGVSTALIGREREVTTVVDLLRQPGLRLLTLTGPGGVGKTRLALAVLAALADHEPAAFAFVPLAPLRDSALVPATIAAALGVRETPGRPLLAAIAATLHDRPFLLALDNAEHLLPATAFVADLLAAIPSLRILVTSRAALRLQGEKRYPVPPLTTPGDEHDPAELVAASPAVALFVERARSVAPDFALGAANAPTVAAICRRLDGLPLAIELAAARVAILTPGELLARLGQRLRVLRGGGHDLPERQRTLRDTIAWSHELLAAGEAAVLRRLAPFAGGWTLDAAEAVCADDAATAEDVIDILDTLLGHSLIQRVRPEPGTGEDETRFAMLETIREFVAEQLDAAGETAAIQRRHAAYFLALAERAEPALWGGAEQHRWLDRLEREHDNLRAALAWALETGEAEIALGLAAALGWLWFIRGHHHEGRRWLEEALACGGDAAAHTRALALVHLGGIAMRQLDQARAVPALEEALALYRAFGDARGQAFALFRLGHMAIDGGRPAEAEAYAEESVALSRDHGESWGLVRVMALGMLGGLLLGRGEHARARPLLEENQALARLTGDRTSIAASQSMLAWADQRAGDLASAAARLDESVAIARALGHRMALADMLDSAGWIAVLRGDINGATRAFAEGIGIADALGLRFRLANLLRGLGAVAGARGHDARAARLFGAAEALSPGVGALSLDSYARIAAEIRARLGETAWTAAWAAGQSLPQSAAIAEATIDSDAEPAPTGASSVPAPAPATPFGLTAREAEVLALLAEGLTDPQIAARLFVSRSTVNAHTKAIYGKLGVNTRAAATRLALEHRLA